MSGLVLGPLDESAIEPWQRSIRLVVGKDVDLETMRTRMAASGAWTDHGAEYGVWRDGLPLGLVQAVYCPRWGVPGCYEIGVLVFDPDERGRGIGTQAVSLFLAHLFEEREAFRVWFMTSPDNAGMRRVGERCGFRFEGTARGSVLLEGELRDEVVYGITRDDPRPALHLV
jgi:RimJ/RimL family protein N-acetyltransferase